MTDSTLPQPARLVRVAVGLTVVHVGASVLALSEALRSASAVVNLILFLLGVVVFLIAFFLAAGRSRHDDVWFGGVFFLSGDVAPADHRRILLGSVAFQCVVGLAVAIAAPFTSAAFAVLVPLAGLALVALYGARFGRFSPKPTDR